MARFHHMLRKPLVSTSHAYKKRPWKSMSVFGIRPMIMINVWRTGLLFLLS